MLDKLLIEFAIDPDLYEKMCICARMKNISVDEWVERELSFTMEHTYNV